MFSLFIAQCIQSLQNVEEWLDKVELHAQQKQSDIAAFMEGRLAVDMKGFIYQIQSACDYMKGAVAWLSGQVPPRHEDNERTIDEVRARIAKTLAFAKGVDPAAYEGAEKRAVTLSWQPGKVIMGADYLAQITIPNVYFHLSMAYAILRHLGVPVGKMDFLGPIRFTDAPRA